MIIHALASGEKTVAQRDLKIQFDRIAQIQAELDAVVRNLASN